MSRSRSASLTVDAETPSRDASSRTVSPWRLRASRRSPPMRGVRELLARTSSPRGSSSRRAGRRDRVGALEHAGSSGRGSPPVATPNHAATPNAVRLKDWVTTRTLRPTQISSSLTSVSAAAPLKPSSWSVLKRDAPIWDAASCAAVRSAELRRRIAMTAAPPISIIGEPPAWAVYWEGGRPTPVRGPRPTLALLE